MTNMDVTHSIVPSEDEIKKTFQFIVSKTLHVTELHDSYQKEILDIYFRAFPHFDWETEEKQMDWRGVGKPTAMDILEHINTPDAFKVYHFGELMLEKLYAYRKKCEENADKARMDKFLKLARQFKRELQK